MFDLSYRKRKLIAPEMRPKLVHFLCNLIIVRPISGANCFVLMYFMMFVLGLSVTARYYVGYTYNLEM